MLVSRIQKKRIYVRRFISASHHDWFTTQAVHRCVIWVLCGRGAATIRLVYWDKWDMRREHVMLPICGIAVSSMNIARWVHHIPAAYHFLGGWWAAPATPTLRTKIIYKNEWQTKEMLSSGVHVACGGRGKYLIIMWLACLWCDDVFLYKPQQWCIHICDRDILFCEEINRALEP